MVGELAERRDAAVRQHGPGLGPPRASRQRARGHPGPGVCGRKPEPRLGAARGRPGRGGHRAEHVGDGAARAVRAEPRRLAAATAARASARRARDRCVRWIVAAATAKAPAARSTRRSADRVSHPRPRAWDRRRPDVERAAVVVEPRQQRVAERRSTARPTNVSLRRSRRARGEARLPPADGRLRRDGRGGVPEPRARELPVDDGLDRRGGVLARRRLEPFLAGLEARDRVLEVPEEAPGQRAPPAEGDAPRAVVAVVHARRQEAPDLAAGPLLAPQPHDVVVRVVAEPRALDAPRGGVGDAPAVRAVALLDERRGLAAHVAPHELLVRLVVLVRRPEAPQQQERRERVAVAVPGALEPQRAALLLRELALVRGDGLAREAAAQVALRRPRRDDGVLARAPPRRARAAARRRPRWPRTVRATVRAAARVRRNGRRARNMCAEASTQIAALRRRA